MNCLLWGTVIWTIDFNCDKQSAKHCMDYFIECSKKL